MAVRSVLDPGLLTEKVVARFWPKTSPGEDGCTVWTGSRNADGYGHFWLVDRPRPAHHIAWMLAHRESIPADRVLDHVCRNRACVNPEHLELVAQRENLRRGESASSATLQANDESGTCSRGHDMSRPGAWRHNARGRYCYACQQEHVKENRFQRRLASGYYGPVDKEGAA